MVSAALPSTYRLIGELFLHPEERDREGIATWGPTAPRVPGELGAHIDAFLSDNQAWAVDEYVQTLELAPPCPLYLGAYLFDEPTSCRGAGTSGRNAYMIELRGIYRHFGFDLAASEMADFLPIMAEFSAISLVNGHRDAIGLRRRYLEYYLQPAVGPLWERLEAYESVYALLASALGLCIDADLAAMGEEPAWQPPTNICARKGISVVTES